MGNNVAFHTLGCKLNYSETSSLSRSLLAEGYSKVGFDDVADVYVINTCSVTENADKECRMLVRRITKRAPEAFIVITGCYAQLKPEEIADIPGVDLVLGAAEKFNLAHHLAALQDNGKQTGKAQICSCDIEDVAGFNSSFSLSGRTRAFLKAQDGCDYNCSFCTIPQARGHSRSDSIDGVLGNMLTLSENGVREIVLTGVNLGDYGKGPEGGRMKETTFFDLIQAMDEQQYIDRIRISSIEPNLLTPEIIQFVSESRKFMPHFHIPLQSGSDAILAQMRRRYRRQLYADRVAAIKDAMPHCCIGVDVIVGFPGETEEYFQETFQFLHELDVSYLHVFTYSERDNTLAVSLSGVVPIAVRNARNKVLRNLSYRKLNHFTEQHIGQTRPVLFEGADKNRMMEGYTDNYIKVQTPYREEWVNEIVNWQLA
jgi:threonylcarbamoyladenosine tRNA methylthiotransferase MtaB